MRMRGRGVFGMGRVGDGVMWDGEMGGWGDGEMGRWVDGWMGEVGEVGCAWWSKKMQGRSKYGLFCS